MEYKDYYKIMGLSRTATPDEIKRAYRKLARKYHPDVSKEANAEAKFKELGEAYEVLKDPKKREAYDRIGRDWQHGQTFTPPPEWRTSFDFGKGFGGTHGGGFSDFFEALFGHAYGQGADSGGYSKQFKVHGNDQYAKIFIDMADAFHGGERLITLNMPQTDSQGRIIAKMRSLNIKIPKGIKAGQRIRLAGQGSPGIGGGSNGDLYLQVEFNPHRYFHSEGRDIHMELPITPWEAALGGVVPVPTLGGRVDLKIPAGSPAGKQLRLKGRGLPGVPAGDQYVTLKIVTPTPKTERAKALYEQMAKEMPMDPRAEMGRR